MTNNEFFEIYSAYQHKHMSLNTYHARTSYLKVHFLPAYGEFTPADITSSDINRIYDNMNSCGLASNTIFGAYAAILSYFKLAGDYGLTSYNPASRR